MKKLLNCSSELEKHRLILNNIAAKWGIGHNRTLEESKILDALIVRESQLREEICLKYLHPPDNL